MAQKNALLMPPQQEHMAHLKVEVKVEGINILTAVTLDDVKRAFESHSIDIALMAVDSSEALAEKLQIIEYIRTHSLRAEKGPSIHFQGRSVSDHIKWITQILETFVAND
jgi:hypothetical protein